VGITFISCEKQKFLWFLVFLTPCLESLAATVVPEDVVEPESFIDSTEEGTDYDVEERELELTRWN
jgi:hypothetical protein